MSLYDKYFSLQNKQHVYSVIANLVYQGTGEMILHNETQINLYKYHYPRIFEETDAEDLVTLNKALVDQVGELILRPLMRKHSDAPKRFPKTSSLSTISEESVGRVLVTRETKSETLDIYSCDRVNGSKNRYDYVSEIHEKKLRLQELTLPKESNPIFALPTIHVWLSEDKSITKIVCQLHGTKCVGGKEFVTYESEAHEPILVNSSLRIQILDHRGKPPLKETDEIPVKKHKRIVYKGHPYTCFALREPCKNIHKEDIIGIYGKETCHDTQSVCEYDHLFVLVEPITLEKPVTHLLNISYQNHLRFEVLRD
jgi:hypothetical protein